MKKIYLASIVAIISILTSCGGASGPAENSNAQTSPAVAKAPGDAIYKKTCIACHQANGEGLGNTYPPLAKSDFISDKEKAITQVLKGYSGELVVNGKKYNNTMPAQQLTDDEIAAVLTYVYSNFGNSGSAVTADEVKAIRAKL
jgi:nitrite reductase (NO-forming)